jgi:serine/threonine protein kinase
MTVCAIPGYQTKSHEELRAEFYSAGRRGPQAKSASSGGRRKRKFVPPVSAAGPSQPFLFPDPIPGFSALSLKAAQVKSAALVLTDKGKALLGDWAVAAQLDLMARVRSLCTEETGPPATATALSDLPSIAALVADHLEAITANTGAPFTTTLATSVQKARSLAQAMADLSALRDELSSGKHGKNLRARISEVPTHDSDEVQALRASLLSQLTPTRKFDPNIPRSALVLDKKPFAHGAFSKAFKGTYEGLPIVAKVFKTDGMSAEDLKSRVAKEASAMAKCQHPNIVRSFGVCADFEVEDGDPFVALVMEPYPEGTASDLLKKRGGALTGPEAALILEGVAHGLGELHRQGIIHKDLKTDNILIEKDSEDGSLHGIIADFGLSVDLAFSSAQYNLGGGTWNYQAPEQLKPYDSKGNGLRITSKVDMYAFGAVAWALATSKEPWEGETPMGIAQRVVDLNQRPTFPAAPDSSWKVIQSLALRCFETDPEKRPTAQEAAEELSRLSE